MTRELLRIIIGATVGLFIGVVLGLLAISFIFFIKFRRRHLETRDTSSQKAVAADAAVDQRSLKAEVNCTSLLLEGPYMKNDISFPGIPKYAYRDLQKATGNFTTVIGQGAFGSVYKACMPIGETLAVKVLSADSKQREKEFYTEIMLLGRLHHRNLVNLLGYCADKGQHILVYNYMSNDSVASHLYGGKHELLSWDLRVNIALDAAKGLEYLHDGAVPSIVHCDIKPSNVLLDQFMRARVADLGLSREAIFSCQTSNVKGTFGYLDPDYISSRTFTKKSDVYSFGVLIFEMIAGRNPQQGLMEYVELAAINTEEGVGWEELVDPRLAGAYDVQEVNGMAALACKCVNPDSGKRPSMRNVAHSLSCIAKARHRRRHREGRKLPLTKAEMESADQALLDARSLTPGRPGEESIDGSSKRPDV